jgi:hypothetical protein
MGNLTQIITEKTNALDELKSTIDGMDWFIEKGDQASLRDVKYECSLLVDELNKKYKVEGYTINDEKFDKIYFKVNEYSTLGIEMMFDFGPSCRGRVPLFQWGQYGNLEMSFTRNQAIPNEVVDLMYELYSSQVQKDVLNIIKNHIEPIRKLKADLADKRNTYTGQKVKVIKELKNSVETMIENGDVITFDTPTLVKGFDCNINSVQFVREPNRKLGVVKVEYQGLQTPFVVDNFFNKKKHAGSIVDIFHAHFYEITNL